jgi:hypothetical protein
MVTFNGIRIKHPTKTSSITKSKCSVRKVQLKPVPSHGHSAVIAGKEGELLEEPLLPVAQFNKPKPYSILTSGSPLHWIAQGDAFVLSLQANI